LALLGSNHSDVNSRFNQIPCCSVGYPYIEFANHFVSSKDKGQLNMPTKFFTRSCVAALALGFVITTVPAYAGFEWVAPSDGASYQPAPQQPSMAPMAPMNSAPSMATSMPEVISPVVISGDTNTNMAPPMKSMAPAPSRMMMPATSPSPAMAPAAPADMAASTISVSSNNDEKTQGFASQIPLALALRQLLPAGYNFSIDQDVDMNTLVSYKGGKSWRETLKDALGSVGLKEHEQGLSVIVSRGGSDMAMTNSPAPSLPPMDAPRNVSQASYLVAPASSAPADQGTYAAAVPDSWTAQRGDTLRKVLLDWCSRANVELQWQAEYDYPVEASAHYSNGFEDAVRNLLAGFDGARPQPVGQLHMNSTAGQMVLVVQARGNNYSN
jgi:Toxin co-regulated pilus biosynthesis protein Q